MHVCYCFWKDVYVKINPANFYKYFSVKQFRPSDSIDFK